MLSELTQSGVEAATNIWPYLVFIAPTLVAIPPTIKKFNFKILAESGRKNAFGKEVSPHPIYQKPGPLLRMPAKTTILLLGNDNNPVAFIDDRGAETFVAATDEEPEEIGGGWRVKTKNFATLRRDKESFTLLNGIATMLYFTAKHEPPPKQIFSR